jgi:hypothetical protein
MSEAAVEPEVQDTESDLGCLLTGRPAKAGVAL